MGRKVSSVRDKDLKASAEAFYLVETEQTETCLLRRDHHLGSAHQSDRTFNGLRDLMKLIESRKSFSSR